jgi:hypothetical protein
VVDITGNFDINEQQELADAWEEGHNMAENASND